MSLHEDYLTDRIGPSSPLATSARAEEVFALISDYNLSDVIERYSSDYNLNTQVAIEHFQELKKFLAICASSEDSIGMAGPVDDAWHTFLLFTKEYQAFCQKLGKFIHHVPDVDDDHDQSSADYTTFLQIYEIAFDMTPPSSIWPYAKTPDGLFAGQSCGGCGSQGGGGGGGSCSHCSACKNDR